MEDNYTRVYSAAYTRLEAFPKHALSYELFVQTVDEAIKWCNVKNFHFKDRIIIELKNNFTVSSTKSSTLSDSDNHKEWYFNDELINRKYWESYRNYLKTDQRYSLDGVNSIDETTDTIMSHMEKPSRKGPWDIRGLVVGSVQSGKTSNFIGLINKAADAGYKGFIVLSGLHNNLRQQTQKRIDHGFLGYDTLISEYTSQHKLPLWKRRKDLTAPVCLTNSSIKGDYKTTASKYNNLITKIPTVLVVKKNKTILQNVIKHFLNAPGMSHSKCHFDKSPFAIKSTTHATYPFIKDYPILVIDDEVDNASVDTGEQYFDENDQPKEEYDPKTINRLIRQLLHIFEKKAYVGYTATPFANIFVHHRGKTKEHGNDIFPKNFIVDLPIPENHTGLEKVFPEEVLDDNEVEDSEIENNTFCQLVGDSADDPNNTSCKTGWMPPSHDKNHIPVMEDESERIPRSLRKAILSFILTCVIRSLRGETVDHKTMLIHVSRFTNVQNRVKELVQLEVEEIRDAFLNNSDKKNKILDEIKEIWISDFQANQNKPEFKHLLYPTWEKISEPKEINMIIQEISKNIKSLNTGSNDELNYQEYKNQKGYGLNTIVIGGDKLSRGLTLEGLTVSYFLRSAKIPMYDTLMQMGRWFGYRAEYEDLCRIYTTKNVIKWFFHITKATAELRALMRTMSLTKPPATPTEFGLRVRDHEVLAITSKYKMRHSRTLKTSFTESGFEFLTFSKKDGSIKKNEKMFEKFLEDIGKPDVNNFKAMGTQFNNSYQWKKIDPSKIVHLLNKFNHFPSETGHSSKSMSDYIQKLTRAGELKHFTVTLLGNGQNDEISLFKKFKVKPLQRKLRTNTDDRIHFAVVTNESIEGCDLTEEEYEKYKDIKPGLETKDKKDKKSKRLGIRRSRSKEKAALNIYPIFPSEDNKELIMTLSISFPSTKLSSEDSCISYKVNTIYENNQ